jgi:hypothetical protein
VDRELEEHAGCRDRDAGSKPSERRAADQGTDADACKRDQIIKPPTAAAHAAPMAARLSGATPAPASSPPAAACPRDHPSLQARIGPEPSTREQPSGTQQNREHDRDNDHDRDSASTFFGFTFEHAPSSCF